MSTVTRCYLTKQNNVCTEKPQITPLKLKQPLSKMGPFGGSLSGSKGKVISAIPLDVAFKSDE